MAMDGEEEHHRNGRFRNPWPSYSHEATFPGFMKMLWKDFDRKQSTPSPEALATLGKPKQPELGLLRSPPIGLVQATWVGHATFLVQFDGFNILTDPVWSDRCSPVRVGGVKRVMPVPFPMTDLPPIDVVIISHNHYDHLDLPTVKLLGNQPVYLVPLGLKSWFKNIGITNVVELDWWQEEHVILSEDGKEKSLRAICTPCQHGSGRGPTDKNKTLWCSWVLEGRNRRVYFAGDTGFCTVPRGSPHVGGVCEANSDSSSDSSSKVSLPVCPAFEEIGKRFGPIDVSFIPIGAYSPRYFMSSVHCSPEDAVGIHLAVRSKQSIGMHWGTFVLTDEPILEPPVRLSKELERLKINTSKFITMRHGDTRSF